MDGTRPRWPHFDDPHCARRLLRASVAALVDSLFEKQPGFP